MNAEPPRRKQRRGRRQEPCQSSARAPGRGQQLGERGLEAGRIAQPGTRSQGGRAVFAAGVQGHPLRDWDLGSPWGEALTVSSA